jgi:hypothetical protein
MKAGTPHGAFGVFIERRLGRASTLPGRCYSVKRENGVHHFHQLLSHFLAAAWPGPNLSQA